VGRRLDLNVTLPSHSDDPPLTEASLLAPGLVVRMHQATGIDYFAFTAGAFPHDFPPFLIGRWRWDNALLLHFLLAADVATVDGSEVVHALHLGMSDSFRSKQHQARAGGRYNDELAEATTGRAHTLGRIDMAAYVLKAARRTGTTRTPEGTATVEEDKEHEQEGKEAPPPPPPPPPSSPPPLLVERRVRTMGSAQLAALRLAGGRGAGLANGQVTLVPVPVGGVDAALEWVCWARRGGVGGNVLLLAADVGEARALALALAGMDNTDGGGGGGGGGGAVVHLHPGAVRVKGGSGGNMQYYRDKKTGRASRDALELGTATVAQRLIRLNLTVTVADVALKWTRDPSPLLLREVAGGGGGDDDDDDDDDADSGWCDLTLVDVDGGSDSNSKGKGNSTAPLYLLRPSRETLRQWRRVLGCIEDKIRHPKRYAPGFSCVRARLLDAVEGLEENGSEDDDGEEEEEEGEEEGAEQPPRPPWRACRVDARAAGSWFPARALLWEQQQQQQRGVSSLSVQGEPWGVLDGDGGGGWLWDEAAGQCVGVLDGWLLEAIEPSRAQ
jgi:hypothetical protein